MQLISSKAAMFRTASKVLVPCNVKNGMFSNERTVQITVENAKTVSLFADTSLIREKGGQKYLIVTLKGDNGKPRYKTILLPSECYETGSPWLSVPERILKTA